MIQNSFNYGAYFLVYIIWRFQSHCITDRNKFVIVRCTIGEGLGGIVESFLLHHLRFTVNRLHRLNRGPILPGQDCLVTSMVMTDVGDTFKLFVTDLRCWWQIKYIEENGHQHLKSVTITHITLSPTSMSPDRLRVISWRCNAANIWWSWPVDSSDLPPFFQTPTRFWSLIKIGGDTMTSTRCNTWTGI